MPELMEKQKKEIVPVPNGTEIAPTYDELVVRYLTFAKKSAESFIKLAETVVIARTTLGPEQFSRFCCEVGLEENGATCRKFLKIGNEASRFEPFVKRMPNSWTSVYKLATLEPDKFEAVAHDSRFAPSMTAAEIDDIVGSPRPLAVEHKRDVVIDLSGLEMQDKVEVYVTLRGLEKRFGFCLKVREEIVTLANAAVPTR